MKEKRISFCQGKGSLTHNNRDFIADNVYRNRIKNNITFIRQDLGDAYEQLFAESTQRYNARQKRNDRKIHGTYYESLFHQKPSKSVVTSADKRKSFYEDVVQIGKMEDSGIGTEDAELVAKCLKEYMAGYQQRNPNFYVFNAVFHMDEATPHLHIDYIPVGHYKRGQDTQNGIAQALKEMGYGEGKQAIARWRAAEVEVLNRICVEHGIQLSEPEKSRGSLEVAEYKEQRVRSERLSAENEKLSDELAHTKSELEKVSQKKVKISEIEQIEVKKSVFGGKVSLSKSDYDKLNDTAKKYVAMEKNTKKLKSENEELKEIVDRQNAELSKYRQSATVSRDKLKQSGQRISETEELKSKLGKAAAFIDACGLRSDFEKFRYNKTHHKGIE